MPPRAQPSTLRRSSRLKENRTLNTKNTSDPEVLHDERCLEERPVKRRRTTENAKDRRTSSVTQHARVGKRKSLSMLPHMPLDILYEVLVHLHPYDLLQLARTTKTLRRLLMTRSSSTIWRRARENVPGLPDCPKDMSEPAYAHLVFDPHCHFCSKGRVMKPMWACRVRTCKSCFAENFVDLGVVFSSMSPRYDAIRPAAMLPAEVVNDRLYFLKRDLDRLLEYLNTLNDDPVAVKAAEAERMRVVEEQEKFAEALDAWSVAEKRRRRAEKIELIHRRQDQIFERLRQCGFDEELDYMTPDLCVSFEEHPLVKQPKELTDRIWNNIKKPMIAWAEAARSKLLTHRHCQHYTERLRIFRDSLTVFYEYHPYPEVVPSVADFSWYTPTFREILDKGREERIEELPIPREELLKTVSAIAEDWRRDMARRLYDMIPPEILRSLNASVTWFRCTVEGCLLDYPRVLVHECAKTGPPINTHPETDMDDLQNAYNIMLREFPWNFTGDKVVCDMDAHRAAEKIVQVTLTNTNAVPTLTDKFWLDNLDERYVCGECSTDGYLYVMPWRVAVKHLSDEKHRGKDVSLTVLNVEDRIEVLDREAELAISDSAYMWGCIHGACRTPAMSLQEIMAHSLLCHGIELPDEGVDYVLHPDAVTTPDVPPAATYPRRLFTTPILR